MDINEFLREIDCSCGKKHICDIDYVYIESGAMVHLKEICNGYNNILIVADENTFSAAGQLVENNLSGKNLRKVIFDGEVILIPNEIAVEKVTENIEGIELIIGIGSGVIQDLCKYVSHIQKIPYIIVATAPSMDGYASNGAAMILNGMKETVAAGLPRAIIADTDVLKNAPMEMIKAGYGDIIGKYSALNDWKLSHIVNDEYFCQYIYDMTFEMVNKTLDLADGLLKRDAKSIEVLMEALVVVGILMSFAGSSRPASGSEHHFSHFFEIVGIVKDEPYLPHGTDVAFSTVITAKIREDILKREFSDKLFRLEEKQYEDKISRIYGDVSKECIALQNRVGNYSNNRISIYKEKEAQIREVLSQMPDSKKIEQLLEIVGLNMNDFYDIYSKEKICNAISYAKDLKDRYTVLWLYYDMFGDEQDVV